jgi:hypothetical protein
MSAKTFVGAAKKEDAKKALQKRPVLVLFYMIGCPHCEANKPAWEDAKKQVDEDTEIVEIESSATPDEEGVNGFPTMKYKDKSGKETETSGQKESGKEIVEELKVPKKKGGSRRRSSAKRSLRRTHRRRDRKLRHRTLRNYVSLRKQFVRPSILPEKFQ